MADRVQSAGDVLAVGRGPSGRATGDGRRFSHDFRDLPLLRYTARLPLLLLRGPPAVRGCPKEVERIVRTYELMTIFRPEMAESDVRTEVDRVANALAERGAEITLNDFWGKRRFAYEINHLNEGYYSVLQFTADPAAITDIDRALSLSDQVVRHKFIRPE